VLTGSNSVLRNNSAYRSHDWDLVDLSGFGVLSSVINLIGVLGYRLRKQLSFQRARVEYCPHWGFSVFPEVGIPEIWSAEHIIEY
jgi:hypothetical protein